MGRSTRIIRAITAEQIIDMLARGKPAWYRKWARWFGSYVILAPLLWVISKLSNSGRLLLVEEEAWEVVTELAAEGNKAKVFSKSADKYTEYELDSNEEEVPDDEPIH